MTSRALFQAALLISALQQQQTTEEEQAIVQDGIPSFDDFVMNIYDDL